MSTKIFDGFKIESQDFLDINKKLDKFREQIFKEAERRITKRIVENAVGRFDNQKIIHGKEDIKFWDCFWEVEQQAFKEQKEDARSLYDVSFSVFLLPIRDITIGVVYSGESDFKQMFFRKRFVKDYAYWNNTDPNEKVSEEEWEQRRKDWGSIGYTPPTEAGFIKQIVPERMHPMMGHDKWKEFFPDKKERTLAVAKDMLFQEWLKENNEDISSNNLFRLFREFSTWQKKDKGGQKRTVKKYKDILPRIEDINLK